MVDDSCEKEVPRVRCDYSSLSFLSIQGQSKVVFLFHPKVFVKPFLQNFRPCQRFFRNIIFTQFPIKKNKVLIRRVCVPLGFNYCYRRFDLQMVLETVLPSLMKESVRIPPLIFHVTISIFVPVVPNPPKSSQNVVPNL